VRKGSKNYVLWVEPRALGVVGVSGASSYGVLLTSTWILWVEWAWLDYMCLHHKFYDNRSFLWHFQLWYTCICVCSRPCYVFMCAYVNMVCQRCMLYDDMYSHDKNEKYLKIIIQHITLILWPFIDCNTLKMFSLSFWEKSLLHVKQNAYKTKMVTKCEVLMSFTMVPICMHGMPICLHMDLDNMLIINNKIILQQHGFVFNNCDNITNKLKLKLKLKKYWHCNRAMFYGFGWSFNKAFTICGSCWTHSIFDVFFTISWCFENMRFPIQRLLQKPLPKP
jgi:hypothetical protein